MTTLLLDRRLALSTLARPLEARGDGFRLRATAAARTTAALAILLARRLRAAVRAVRVAALALFFFLANRRFTTRFDHRVRDRLRDQLHRANRVVVARDRHRDEIRIRVRVDDGDDRDVQLVRFADADALLLRVDDEHQPGQPAHVANAVQIFRELLTLAAEHELLLLGVVLELAALFTAG